MNYVIDFNILFSSLLSGKALYKSLFKQNSFYIPDFAFIELQKYENLIFQKSRLDNEQIREYSKFIFSRLTVLPSLVISNKNRQYAYDLCKNVDLKDMSYVALSIELGITLITRDKPLYKTIRKNKYKDIILFDSFIDNNF